MEKIKSLFESMTKHLEKLARGNAVVAKPLSVGDRHIIPLCELGLAVGAGGGTGEGGPGSGDAAGGTGGMAGGAAKATPVAIIVVEGGKARIQKIGK